MLQLAIWTLRGVQAFWTRLRGCLAWTELYLAFILGLPAMRFLPITSWLICIRQYYGNGFTKQFKAVRLITIDMDYSGQHNAFLLCIGLVPQLALR